MWSLCEQPSLPIPSQATISGGLGITFPTFQLPTHHPWGLNPQPSPCLTFPCLQEEKGLILPHCALGKETISQS